MFTKISSFAWRVADGKLNPANNVPVDEALNRAVVFTVVAAPRFVNVFEIVVFF